MWFPHRFSILRSKVTPKGPPDGYGLPLAMKWDSFIATGLFGSIFFLKQSLCIYPYAELCFFSVRSTYFSKNHPTSAVWQNSEVGHYLLTLGSERGMLG